MKKIILINILTLFLTVNFLYSAEQNDCSNLGMVEKKACQSKNVGNKIGSKMPNFIKRGFEKMKESNRELK
tara:strand:+ start:68 stop:280 length:213 start_codon:yes stop_codon:yes gene_type:complete